MGITFPLTGIACIRNTPTTFTVGRAAGPGGMAIISSRKKNGVCLYGPVFLFRVTTGYWRATTKAWFPTTLIPRGY